MAGWLLTPLVRLFAERGRAHPEELERLRRHSETERVPMASVQELVGAMIVRDGDMGLALRAGALADLGLHSYLVKTAATVEGAISAGCQYMPLISSAISGELSVDAYRATVTLESSVVLSKVDMALLAGMIHSSYLSDAIPPLPALEWRFPHPPPADPGAYREVLNGAGIRFGAAGYGYSFATSILRHSRPLGDVRLHAMLRRHADGLLVDLLGPTTARAMVEAAIARVMRSSRPQVADIAASLGMSSRTLARRLSAEGTSFSILIDECQRAAAIEYVSRSALTAKEIAERLHLGDSSSFHRTFRRWTGRTPGQYRRMTGGRSARFTRSAG